MCPEVAICGCFQGMLACFCLILVDLTGAPGSKDAELSGEEIDLGVVSA